MIAEVADEFFLRLFVMIDRWQYYGYQFISFASLALFLCLDMSLFWSARFADTNKRRNDDANTDTYREFHGLIIAEKYC